MDPRPQAIEEHRIVGRYVLHDEIASGGMATVRFGRLLGPVGFSRTVAVKCLHPQFAKDPEFAAMFMDEARLAARVRHPNVVPILDVVALDDDLFLVMEFVQGESLSKLLRVIRQRKARVPLRVTASIISGMLEGLHAAHEARSEQGEPLNIVHRDVSPQNVIVGLDGVSRVLDFGVAKAAGRIQSTREGQLKGKLAYMAPEQLRAGQVDRRTDIYASAVVLWECLTGRRLFKADDEIGIFGMVLEGKIDPPSSLVPTLPKGYDEVAMRGLDRDPAKRWQTAQEMAIALEKVAGVASPREVGAWVEQLAKDTLARRAERIAEIESVSSASLTSHVGPVGGAAAMQSDGPGTITNPSRPSVVTHPSAVTHTKSAQYVPAPPPAVPPPPRLAPPRLAPPPPLGALPAPVPPPVSIPHPTLAHSATTPAVTELEPEEDPATVISDTSHVSRSFSGLAVGGPVPVVAAPTDTAMTGPVPAPKRGSSGLLAVIAVGVLSLAIAVAAVAFLVSQRSKPTEPAPSESVAPPPTTTVAQAQSSALAPNTVPTETVTAPPQEPTAAAPVAPVASEEPPAAEPTATRTVKVPKGGAAPTTTAAKTSTPAATGAPPSTPKGDCNPPYTIDARGVRVPKPNCL